MEIKERMVWMGMNEGGINEGRKGRISTSCVIFPSFHDSSDDMTNKKRFDLDIDGKTKRQIRT